MTARRGYAPAQYSDRGKRYNIRPTHEANPTQVTYRPIFPYILPAALLAIGFQPSAVKAASPAESIVFSGASSAPVVIEPGKSTGLDCLYVVRNTRGVTLSYRSSGNLPVEWSRYGSLGGGYAEPVEGLTVDGDTYSITLSGGDSGYIIKEGDSSLCFWVTDYASHALTVSAMTVSPDSGCDATVLDIDGEGAPIHYFTINGRQETLSRELRITSLNLVWDSERSSFVQQTQTNEIAGFTGPVTITPPAYCQTSYTLSGDRFLQQWGDGVEIESNFINPTAVAVSTSATQADSGLDTSNRIDTDSEGLGGSAPCTVSFNAEVSDGVVHYEWQMASDPEFEDITYRLHDRDIDFTFTQEGTTYVRFIGSNADGSCEAFGDDYTVSIGASELLVPNAFSPGDDGINDEWKVSYRSIVEFECHIFDRNGHQIHSFNSPDQGWDGKRNGKFVAPGVYFYVIKAVGADGKKYNRSGDINIIRYNGGRSSLPASE